MPPEYDIQLRKLGSFPGAPSRAGSHTEAWQKILSLKTAAPAPAEWAEALNPLETIDANKRSVGKEWRKVDDQVVSPETPNARIQLVDAVKSSYRFEAQFTRIRGDCMAVMFPVKNTSALLVVSGWKGKVSGLAYLNGKDAARNLTTRDGQLSNGDKHALALTVNVLQNDHARITVTLDGQDYMNWEGPTSALKPDRQWRLQSPHALGIDAYNAAIVFHSCRFQLLDSTR
ncbi:MAG: hypothetical protein ACI8W8_000863 [Rhodothermales bacterium]|jgi:hypothetical protein